MDLYTLDRKILLFIVSAILFLQVLYSYFESYSTINNFFYSYRKIFLSRNILIYFVLRLEYYTLLYHDAHAIIPSGTFQSSSQLSKSIIFFNFLSRANRQRVNISIQLN